MKKLLILILVLGIAPAASALVVQLGADGSTNGAGLDLEVVATSITLEVYSDSDDVAYTRYLYISDTTEIDFSGSMTIYYSLEDGHAGDNASETDYGTALGAGTHTWEIKAVDSGSPFNITAGKHFSITVTGQGTVALLSEDLGTTLDTVTLVPEPATVALLGLGGLFLLRRRR